MSEPPKNEFDNTIHLELGGNSLEINSPRFAAH